MAGVSQEFKDPDYLHSTPHSTLDILASGGGSGFQMGVSPGHSDFSPGPALPAALGPWAPDSSEQLPSGGTQGLPHGV